MPQSQYFTHRHLLVRKLVKLSIIATAVFGAGSFAFAFFQNEYNSKIEASRNIAALRITLLLDKEELLDPLNKEINKCFPKRPSSCTKLIELLIQTKNRGSDYKIFFENTIGAPASDPKVKEIAGRIDLIDKIPNKLFGISLSNAAKLNIQSAEQYVNYYSNINTINNGSSHAVGDARLAVNSLFNSMENISAQLDGGYNKSISGAKFNLTHWLIAIILAEIIIYALVSAADLAINNSDPSANNELRLKVVQAKVIPLGVSILLGFLMMTLGQIMLFRQTTDILIDQCRDQNQQSISFMSRIESATVRSETIHAIGPLIELPSYCSKFVNQYPDVSRALSLFNEKEVELLREQLKHALVNYADSFQSIQRSRSRINAIILQSILAFNVTSLLALSIFLKFDSEELG